MSATTVRNVLRSYRRRVRSGWMCMEAISWACRFFGLEEAQVVAIVAGDYFTRKITRKLAA